MTYLSVSNFWKYQNADVWKKSRTHPPWFKHFVHRDREMDALPLEARLLWSELLGAATRYSNVLEADLNWIYAETRVPTDVIAEMLPLLLKGGWIHETETPRRSRKPSRDALENFRAQEEEEDRDKETPQTPHSRNGKAPVERIARANVQPRDTYDRIAAMIRNGVPIDDAYLDAESLSDEQRDELRAMLHEIGSRA